jgi:hypothetical protein
MLRTLFAIYFGHLLADFLFQTNRLVEQKRAGKSRAYLIHGLIHYFSCALLLGFFVRGSLLSPRTQFALVALTLVHLLIDFSKIKLTGRLVKEGPWAYLCDQAAHLATVIAAAVIIAPAESFAELAGVFDRARVVRNAVILIPVVYIAVVFGGGYFVRFLTRSLAEGAERNSHGKSETLQNAGLYIGWLERFLVITALLLQSPAMIGLIFTAKSIARYPEFKSERFAEYFLIGTLLSLSIAILGGVLLRGLLNLHAAPSI